MCSLLTGTDCPYDVVLNYPFYIVSLIASMSTGACVFLTMCTTKVCTAYLAWPRVATSRVHAGANYLSLVVATELGGVVDPIAERLATSAILRVARPAGGRLARLVVHLRELVGQQKHELF